MAPFVAVAIEAGILPALDEDQSDTVGYVHPVGVSPVLTRSAPQVTNQGYPGLSQFIW